MHWDYRDCHDLKLSNRPVRTRMPGGVAGAPPTMEAPYADCMCRNSSGRNAISGLHNAASGFWKIFLNLWNRTNDPAQRVVLLPCLRYAKTTSTASKTRLFVGFGGSNEPPVHSANTAKGPHAVRAFCFWHLQFPMFHPSLLGCRMAKSHANVGLSITFGYGAILTPVGATDACQVRE